MKTYEKMFLASLGIVDASAKEAKRLLKLISEKKRQSSKELEKALGSLIKEGKSRQAEVSKKIKSAIKDTLKELDIPTRNELRQLEKKVNKLAQK